MELGSKNGDLIAAGLALALGGYALSQTGEMSELGAVFPTTAAIVLILAALGLGLRVVLRRGNSAGEQGLWSGLEWPRLIGLSITLLAWALLLKPIGFLPVAALGLLAVGAISYRERMGLKALAFHILAAAALLAGFYALFAMVLRVPLP